MRAVVQRVSRAGVVVDGREVASIGHGLHVYIGVDAADEERDAVYLADKVRHLRIFPDAAGKMNLDALQAGGDVLVVSAFTVSADARRGRRPSFDTAAGDAQARRMYDRFCAELARLGLTVQTGVFGASMEVQTTNTGPVCILLDSHKVF